MERAVEQKATQEAGVPRREQRTKRRSSEAASKREVRSSRVGRGEHAIVDRPMLDVESLTDRPNTKKSPKSNVLFRSRALPRHVHCLAPCLAACVQPPLTPYFCSTNSVPKYY